MILITQERVAFHCHGDHTLSTRKFNVTHQITISSGFSENLDRGIPGRGFPLGQDRINFLILSQNHF